MILKVVLKMDMPYECDVRSPKSGLFGRSPGSSWILIEGVVEEWSPSKANDSSTIAADSDDIRPVF